MGALLFESDDITKYIEKYRRSQASGNNEIRS